MKKLLFVLILTVIFTATAFAEFNKEQFAKDLLSEMKETTPYKCKYYDSYGTPSVEVTTKDGLVLSIYVLENYLWINYINTYSNYKAYIAEYDGELSIGTASVSGSVYIIFPSNGAPISAYVESIKKVIEQFLAPIDSQLNDFTFSL